MHTAQQIIYSEVSHQHRKESQHHISMEEPGVAGRRQAMVRGMPHHRLKRRSKPRLLSGPRPNNAPMKHLPTQHQ